MTSYFLRKLLPLGVVLLVVSTASFLLMTLLPGDVALALLGNEATPEAVAQVRAELGLDQPLLLRYLHWLAGFMRGDLGRSYITQVPVMESILDRLPPTRNRPFSSKKFHWCKPLYSWFSASLTACSRNT